MNNLFAFQIKYAKQNVVLKIIDAKRYALFQTALNPQIINFKKQAWF